MTNFGANMSTTEWQELDADHHMHPFTDYKDMKENKARVIVKGEGVYVTDSEGHKILDGMAGLWCVNVGYGRKELADVAYQQMQELPYYNLFFKTTNQPATALAKTLTDLAPGNMNHVFFAGSGSEAVDSIIRTVRHYWKLEGQPEKNILISRHNAYHGSTLAGASLGGFGGMHDQAGDLPNFAHITEPYSWKNNPEGLDEDAFAAKCAQALEDKILELGPERVAAFVGEPVQGAGGVIIPPQGYWPRIEAICKKYDILLVADEVICGYGRTGNWFGCQTYGFTPDLMSTAKGLSSGYLPISAVFIGDRVMNSLVEKGGEYLHGFTYSGHPVAAAVAKANIDIIRDEQLIEQIQDSKAAHIAKWMDKLKEHPLVGETRSVGLVGAIELSPNNDSGHYKPVEGFEEGQIGVICRDHCVANGVMLRATRDAMIFSPPLTITLEEIDIMFTKALEAFDLTMKDIAGNA